MDKLTPEQKLQYVVTGGFRCPYCGSTDIESGQMDFDDYGQMIQEVVCHHCKKEWQDVYVLFTIRENKEVQS